jgi:hypothetical protein
MQHEGEEFVCMEGGVFPVYQLYIYKLEKQFQSVIEATLPVTCSQSCSFDCAVFVSHLGS